MHAVPFDCFEHLVTLPVTAGRAETRFVFDSGMRVERDGPSTVVHMPLELPNGRRIEVDVRFAVELGVDLESPDVRKVEGRDETGHEYARYFTSLRGGVRVPSAPELEQRDPDVMFQRIVSDGLVGQAFLRNYIVTFDVPNERMAFRAQ